VGLPDEFLLTQPVPSATGIDREREQSLSSLSCWLLDYAELVLSAVEGLYPDYPSLDLDISSDIYQTIKLKYKGIGMETIIPISELQSQAKKIVERVKNTRDTVIITQRGRPAALLVNYEDYEGMVATLEEMSQPDWRERLAEAERDSKAGKGIELGEFKTRRVARGKKS